MWTVNSVLSGLKFVPKVKQIEFKEKDRIHRDSYIRITNTSRPVLEHHVDPTRITNQNATKDLINYYYGRLNIIDVKIGQVLRFSTLAFGAAAFLSHQISENSPPIENIDLMFGVCVLGMLLLAFSIWTGLQATMLKFEHMDRPEPATDDRFEECFKTYLDTISAVTADRLNVLRRSLYSAIVGALIIAIEVFCVPPLKGSLVHFFTSVSSVLFGTS